MEQKNVQVVAGTRGITAVHRMLPKLIHLRSRVGWWH